MEFVSELPSIPSKRDSVWVIVDQLTKSAHFILVRTNYSLQKLAKIYISRIIRLHGVPVLIISDRDPHFTSQFWKKLHEALLGERWVWDPELVSETEDKVRLIQDRLKAGFDRQKSYGDLKRRDIKYFVGDFVFLKVSLWKKVLRFSHKRKLSPRFIGSYQILKCVGPVAYQLELPLELDRIHDMFYVSMLKRYRSDLSHVVSIKEIENELAGSSGKGVNVLEVLRSNSCVGWVLIFAQLTDRV
ncbi:uncharacterized protein [Gossypium hirsutum]|uniref:Tf2-1-like SH3-like domain-containing protein n=1 Tax=Gossypium hirsutum TaxID=3635 RepID=A0A1U8JKN9_GOSHI|nr:uncharacterized protein LOC107908095 [Gossypium hirsutum]